MNYIEENLKTPISGEYDVIIVGGGPAGVGAAVASGRCGLKTLLIEQTGCLGGMQTSGLVNPMFDNENKSGLVREIVDELRSGGKFGAFWDMCFDYEYMKRLLDKKVTEAGVKILFNTRFVKTIVEETVVKGVIIESKRGREAFFSKMVIDCSGDADAAVSAGVKTYLGSQNGELQSATLMFMIGNTDYMQDGQNDLYNIMKENLEKPGCKYKLPFIHAYIIKLPGMRNAVVQLTHMRVNNPIDPFEVSQLYIEGRKQAVEAFEFLKTIPMFSDITLLQTAPLIGIRESRRIEGEYTLTAEDMVEGKKFDDGFTTVTFNIDIHKADGSAQNCIKTKPYEIPFRCLIPKGYDGIIVAGKTISGTHEAMASYRVTSDCMAMGEAAGYAVNRAIKNNINIREVNIKEAVPYI